MASQHVESNNKRQFCAMGSVLSGLLFEMMVREPAVPKETTPKERALSPLGLSLKGVTFPTASSKRPAIANAAHYRLDIISDSVSLPRCSGMALAKEDLEPTAEEKQVLALLGKDQIRWRIVHVQPE